MMGWEKVGPMDGERKSNLTDPREIRKHLYRAARTGERIDGKPGNHLSVGIEAGLVRRVLDLGIYSGFSGEDTMTVLAYHALLMMEQAYDRVLDVSIATSNPAILFKGAVEKGDGL